MFDAFIARESVERDLCAGVLWVFRVGLIPEDIAFLGSSLLYKGLFMWVDWRAPRTSMSNISEGRWYRSRIRLR